MLIQGPLGINWTAPSHPRIENASLTSENWGRPDRIGTWIDCNVHVAGRPEWLFVKLHTHGAVDRDVDALFGDKAMHMHRLLNQHYNDGKRYRLHYVTARQAYNIAKAAEHGHAGNPDAYLDFQVAPPATAYYAADTRHVLEQCSPTRLKMHTFDVGQPVHIRARVGPIASLSGSIDAYEVDTLHQRIRIDAGGAVALTFHNGARAVSVEGGTTIDADGKIWQLSLAPSCTLS